jgi:hypothetical protein
MGVLFVKEYFKKPPVFDLHGVHEEGHPDAPASKIDWRKFPRAPRRILIGLRGLLLDNRLLHVFFDKRCTVSWGTPYG